MMSKMMMMKLVWMMLCLLHVMMTHSQRNAMMRREHGNIDRKIHVAHQNLPDVLSAINKQTSIEELFITRKPQVLALSEPRWSELSTFSFEGYTLIKGMQKGVKDPRLNVLVQDGLHTPWLTSTVNYRLSTSEYHLRT